jgi:hypothetical protein
MGVSDEAKNVIPLKFLRKIKTKNFFPLVNSIRGHTVYNWTFLTPGTLFFQLISNQPKFLIFVQNNQSRLFL